MNRRSFFGGLFGVVGGLFGYKVKSLYGVEQKDERKRNCICGKCGRKTIGFDGFCAECHCMLSEQSYRNSVYPGTVIQFSENDVENDVTEREVERIRKEFEKMFQEQRKSGRCFSCGPCTKVTF